VTQIREGPPPVKGRRTGLIPNHREEPGDLTISCALAQGATLIPLAGILLWGTGECYKGGEGGEHKSIAGFERGKGKKISMEDRNGGVLLSVRNE